MRLLCLVILAAIMTGCQRRSGPPLKRDGSPAEIVAQFTNLLATGNTPDRIGAVSALGTLALESWDQSSKQAALTAMLRALRFADTNIQKEVWSNLSYQSDPELLPSWSSAAIANAATPELKNFEPRIRCAAASLLLRQEGENDAAASVLLSLLNDGDQAVRLRAGNALVLESKRNELLTQRLLAQLRILAATPEVSIRLEALARAWEMKPSKFSAARVEVELALLELLRSKDVSVRRKAVDILLSRPFSVAELATIPLQDFVKNGLVDPDPYIATTMAHVVNEGNFVASLRPKPVPGTLDVLKRGLSDPDPAVRLAALSPMSGHSMWWRVSNGTNGSPEWTSPDPMILQPLTNALHDASLEIRLSAVQVLQYLSNWSESPLDVLWQVKIATVESLDPTVRRMAFRRTASLPNPPPRFIELFRAALKDPDWQIRLSAMQPVWLSGLNGFYADQRLWSPLCGDPVPAVRVDAGNLLGREAAGQGRGTNAPWSVLPAEIVRLVDDPFPNVSLVGLIALRQLAATTNQTPVVLEARERLHQIAVGANPGLKVRLARCYARTYSWAKSPDTEKQLQILAVAPEGIVRRHAAGALRYLGLPLPNGIQDDSDPEVRIAATKAILRNFPTGVPTPDGLEALLQKLKEGDPATRRKAAMVVARDEVARKRSGVAAETVRVLLETYTNAPPAEFDSINRLLCSQFAPNYASLQAQVHAFAVQTILSGELGVKRGVWPLLARVTSRNTRQTDQILAIAAAGLRRTQDPDVIVRASVIRVLADLEPELVLQSADTNAVVARQVRTALVEALGDHEPEVAISAAATFLETPGNGFDKLNRLLLDAELRDRAALILEGRLADPQLEVRRNMASALALMGAHRFETNSVDKALSTLEGLFTQSGSLLGFCSSSSTDISQVNLPSADGTLRVLAFGSPDPAIRQRAILTIARLLDAMAKSDDFGISISQILVLPISSGRFFTPNEIEPVRKVLVRIAGSENTALADEAARCLSHIRVQDEILPGDLVRRAHSGNAAERRLAMLELGNPNQSLNERFREEATRLAQELTSDSEDSVRMAALEAFTSNVFPIYGVVPREILTIDPLVKALNDSVPEIQLKAFYFLSANLRHLQATNREQLALPLIKRMMTVKFPDGHNQFSGFVADLAGFVQDQSARQRFLLDAQEKINRADNDTTRSQWLAAMGRLYLGFNQPNKAAEAFRKAIRLDPNFKDDSVLRDLESALLSAGRYNEVAMEPAPRPNGFEYLSHLEALAKEQNAARLVLVANRALDGYLPVYGGRTQIGSGEPDLIIRETARLLGSLGKLDVVEDFLKGALKRYPESPEVPIAQANLRVAQVRKEEAKLLLELELNKHVWNEAALQLLGTLCQDTGQTERYKTLLRSLVEKHPGQLSLCRPMVELCVRAGQINEARTLIVAFDAAAGAVIRNSGIQDFTANPEFSSRYFVHQSAMSQLLELCDDLDGAIAAQIEANKTTSYNPHLITGQRRLDELNKRAGKPRATPPVK